MSLPFLAVMMVMGRAGVIWPHTGPLGVTFLSQSPQSWCICRHWPHLGHLCGLLTVMSDDPFPPGTRHARKAEVQPVWLLSSGADRVFLEPGPLPARPRSQRSAP